jgi:uncharacterized protein (TIGR02246 family)
MRQLLAEQKCASYPARRRVAEAVNLDPHAAFRSQRRDEMKRFLILLACAVSIFSGSSQSHAQNSGAAPEDEASIRAIIIKITDAFNRHDVKARSQFYAPDADEVNVAGQSATGLAEIEKFSAAAHSTRLKDATIKTLNVTIRFIRPDVAIVRETHEMSGFRGPDGAKVPPYQETSLRVFEKENGNWLVATFQNTTVAATQKRD